MEMVNPDLWKYGMTLIIGSLTVFFLCGAYVAGKYFQSSPQRATEDTNNFLTSQGAVRLATVGAVAFVVCILSLFGVLNEGAIAILSGITGYVLGGIPAPIAKSPK
jgi:glucose uptake protein GlcU